MSKLICQLCQYEAFSDCDLEVHNDLNHLDQPTGEAFSGIQFAQFPGNTTLAVEATLSRSSIQVDLMQCLKEVESSSDRISKNFKKSKKSNKTRDLETRSRLYQEGLSKRKTIKPKGQDISGSFHPSNLRTQPCTEELMNSKVHAGDATDVSNDLHGQTSQASSLRDPKSQPEESTSSSREIKMNSQQSTQALPSKSHLESTSSASKGRHKRKTEDKEFPEVKRRKYNYKNKPSPQNRIKANKGNAELLQNEARSKLFQGIRATVELCLKHDSAYCHSNGKDENLTDDEIAELANSILTEFGDCKKQYGADFEYLLEKIKREHEKTTTYKCTASKLTAKASQLEANLKEIETEKNKKIAMMQKNVMELETKIGQLEKLNGKTHLKKLKMAEDKAEQKTKMIELLAEKLSSAEKKVRADLRTEAEIGQLQKDLKCKEDIISALQMKVSKVKEIEEKLRKRETTIEELQYNLAELENTTKKMKQADVRTPDAKSLLKIAILEEDLASKEQMISDLRAKCNANEKHLKLLEKTADSFESLKRLREKEGELFTKRLSAAESSLCEQNELVEVLQWSLYIVDKRHGSSLTKTEK